MNTYDMLDEEGEDNAQDPSPKSPKIVDVIRVLAAVTVLMIPMAILVNIFFSYRLDPAGFFKCYSNYTYDFDFLTCENDKSFTSSFAKTACKSYSSAFWTHKLTTIFWTCTIILHICLITVWGKLNWGVHEILGFSVILTANLAATSGLIMVSADLVRYDNFTNGFVIAAAVIVYLLSFFWLLAFIFYPRINCCSTTYNLHHSNFGFLFLLPPLAMLIQFILYSTIIAMIGRENGGCSEAPRDSDYTVWRVTLSICGLIAFGMSLCFYFSYFKITKPYVVKKKPEEEMQAICCGCIEVRKSALSLCGNLVETTPIRIC